MPAERLQKIIAAAGVASRRKSEELISSGRVLVNGQVVTELGTKADPEQDHIRVDGKLLQGPERYTYVVLNKPKGYVTTVSDEKKRPTVMDLVQKVKGRVYPVGRLDWASEGLLLMTNDGGLANALMKAASNVAKVYVVKVAGQPDEGKLDKLRRGVSIAEKGGRRVRTAPAKIRLIREGDNPSESGCVGNESCQSAEPTHNSACTESSSDQAAAHTEVGAAVETTARTEALALGQAVVCTALTQSIALVKAWNVKIWNVQAVSRTQAQARLGRRWRAGRPARWTGEDARRSTVTKLSAWVP